MWILNQDQTDLINLDKATALFVRNGCLFVAIHGIDNQRIYEFKSEEEAKDALMRVAKKIGTAENA